MNGRINGTAPATIAAPIVIPKLNPIKVRTSMKPRIPLPKKTEKIHKDKSKYKRKPPPDGDRMGIPTGAASELEFPNSGLLISAVVISREFGRPGKGFYDLALFTISGNKADADGLEELTFWNHHVEKLVAHYGKKT